MEEKHFTKMAQNALKIPLRMKFDDVEFIDVQEVAQKVGKYELLFREDIQRRISSKPTYGSKPTYFKTPSPVPQVEVFGEDTEEAMECLAMEVAVLELVPQKNPIMCKTVVRLSKEQRRLGVLCLTSKIISHIPLIFPL